MTAVLPAACLTCLLLVQPSPPTCATWQACRHEALDAAASGEHETFHDLAWRAVQLRRESDPDLMHLLARAQSLSGRPHDALVMLRRLADMGVPTHAATHEDFRRVRALPGWPELQARIDAAAVEAPAEEPPPGAPATLPGPSEDNGSTPATLTPHPEGVDSPALTRTVVSSEVARFAAPPFTPGGLAYDSASRRLVIGNLPERKLTVVGDGLNRSATLAGAAAGFLGPVAALEIDRTRGDLWVISGGSPGTEGDVGGSALHKLQLISGRVLRVLKPEPALGLTRLIDVAVAANSEPLVLDSEGPRLLHGGSDGEQLSLAMDLPPGKVTSLATAGRGRVAFVAYSDRLLRVDLAGRRSQRILADQAGTSAGLERIRWHLGTLLGVQRLPSGQRRIVQLRLFRDQLRVVGSTSLDTSLPADVGPIDLAVFEEELYYLISPGEGREAVVRRLPLR